MAKWRPNRIIKVDIETPVEMLWDYESWEKKEVPKEWKKG